MRRGKNANGPYKSDHYNQTIKQNGILHIYIKKKTIFSLKKTVSTR